MSSSRGWPSFFFKAHRTGPTDYLCEFDHDNFQRACQSVLWHGQWARQTEQVMGVMKTVGFLRDGISVLDYGCGVGRVTAALLASHRLNVQAVDRSEHMLVHARRHLSPYLGSPSLAISSDVDLFASTVGPAFDLVLLIEVAQHVPEPILRPLLERLASLIQPAGHLFIYGNEMLDVNGRGEIGVTPVADVVGRTVRIVRSDEWPFEPEPRWSFVCAPRPYRATSRSAPRSP